MKIHITIEGDDVNQLIKDVGALIEANREEIRQVLRALAKEMLAVIEEDKILEKGADFYIHLNRTINDKYQHKEKNRN